MQLTNYKNISSSLLDNNTSKNTEILQLHDKIFLLEKENEQFINKIAILEEELISNQIQLNRNENLNNYNPSTNVPSYNKFDDEEIKDKYSDYNIPNNITPYKKTNEKKIDSSSLTPSIEIDREEESITGIGVQYEQRF